MVHERAFCVPALDFARTRTGGCPIGHREGQVVSAGGRRSAVAAGDRRAVAVGHGDVAADELEVEVHRARSVGHHDDTVPMRTAARRRARRLASATRGCPPAHDSRAVTSASDSGTRRSRHDVDIEGDRRRRGASNAGGRSATTITGRHASTRAWYAGLGWRSWPEHGPGHRRLRVGEGELREPAGRPVLQPSQLLDVVLETVAWYACVAAAPLVERRVRRGRHVPIEDRLLQRVVRGRARSQSRSGHCSGSMKSRVRRHRLRAELADEPHHPRHGRGRSREVALVARCTNRSRGACRCRRASGGVAATPEWAITGRLPSARSKRALHRAVEDACGSTSGAPDRPRASDRTASDRHRTARRRRRPARCARTTARSMDGGRGGRLPCAPGGSPACGRCGRSPTARACPAREHAPLVGSVVQLGPPDVRVHAQRGRVRHRSPGARRAASSSGVASPSAMRGRAVVGSLEEQPLAIDRHDPVAHRHRPKARCARSRRWLTSSPTSTATDTSCSGWSPSAHGHHSAGLSTPNAPLDAGSRPRASECSTLALREPATVVRTATGVRLVAVERRRRTRRSAASASASRQSTRRRLIRTGPLRSMSHRTPEATGVPVGVDAVPVLEHARDVALRGAIGRRRARDLDREHVLGASRASAR